MQREEGRRSLSWKIDCSKEPISGDTEGLFDSRLETRGGDKMELKFGSGTHLYNITPPEKWEKVATGQWIQRAAWKIMVTRPAREQPHSTPVKPRRRPPF